MTKHKKKSKKSPDEHIIEQYEEELAMTIDSGIPSWMLGNYYQFHIRPLTNENNSQRKNSNDSGKYFGSIDSL